MRNKFSVDHNESETDIKVEKLDGRLYIRIEEDQLEEVKRFIEGHGYLCEAELAGNGRGSKIYKLKIYVEDAESELLIIQKILDEADEIPNAGSVDL